MCCRRWRNDTEPAHATLPKTPVHDPHDSPPDATGFPSLHWEDEEVPTRPLPLHERPLQARIDSEMAVIAAHHPRIARAIETFWGHHDCVEYLKTLILSGGYSEREHRVGFKSEVLSALINLAALHRVVPHNLP